MGRIPIACAVALALSVSVSAQWLGYREPGIPRTADGKPNLSAPAPRTPEGKPDLSGLWEPEASPYRFDVIQDVKDEGIFQPGAEALFLKRAADLRRDNPVTHCLPAGPSAIFASGATRFYRIVQSPKVIALLYELGGFRQIYTDGRPLPKDPNPAWLGYSTGHWEGNTLVVESAGFNDKSWLDMVGHPHSERLRVTEKLHRVDFGHMQIEVTYDDPETLTRPLTISSGGPLRGGLGHDRVRLQRKREGHGASGGDGEAKGATQSGHAGQVCRRVQISPRGPRVARSSSAGRNW